MPTKPRYKLAHRIGQVELYKHPEGHKFLRFSDSSMQPHEIIHPNQIPTEDHIGVNFVTNLKTEINGKKQKIWAKEAGSDFDYTELNKNFKDMKRPYARRVHHARVLRELRAAGFQAPEPLGILYPKNGKALMLTTHQEGTPADLTDTHLSKLRKAGFVPQDLHSNNLYETKNGLAIIDASLFFPTDKTLLAEAIKKAKAEKEKQKAQIKKLTLWQRIIQAFRK